MGIIPEPLRSISSQYGNNAGGASMKNERYKEFLVNGHDRPSCQKSSIDIFFGQSVQVATHEKCIANFEHSCTTQQDIDIHSSITCDRPPAAFFNFLPNHNGSNSD